MVRSTEADAMPKPRRDVRIAAPAAGAFDSGADMTADTSARAEREPIDGEAVIGDAEGRDEVHVGRGTALERSAGPDGLIDQVLGDAAAAGRTRVSGTDAGSGLHM